METTCKYVGSRGLLKLCDFRASNPMSGLCLDPSYLYQIRYKQFHNMSIYICAETIPFFVENILKDIRCRFVLLSGDSDSTIANMHPIIEKIVTNPYLIKWFSQNNLVKHPKIQAMPIGLDYHTILMNPNFAWKDVNEGILPINQEQILLSIPQVPFFKRINKIYCNYTPQNDYFGDRKRSECIPADLLYKTSGLKRTAMWKEMVNYTFVLSPKGNGIDCHRTWEALCLGCIPIVSFSYSVFEDLPVLVAEWDQVTQELLDKTLEEFQTRTFNYDKLTLAYWKNKIKENI